MDTYGYRFSFGPWNIHEGADPFGPPVRPSIAFDKKLEAYKRWVRRRHSMRRRRAGLDEKSPEQIVSEARALKHG